MPKTLIIIESPKKRQTVQKALGEGVTVMASFGHVRDLPQKDLGVDLTTYRPTYVVAGDRAENVLAQLAKAVKAHDHVLLATDPDREGEAIAWHLQQSLRLLNAQRISFSEITPAAIRQAMDKPRAVNLKLVRAQEARRILDRLVGYQASPVVSDALAQRLSAGRVQSPALRLVVDRERQIQSHVVIHYFTVSLDLGGHHAKWKPNLPAGQKHCTDQVEAERARAVTTVDLVAANENDVSELPPPPFTTATLQEFAQKRLGFKPKQTMQLAQSLYEAGLITYMRTDSPNISDDAFRVIQEQFGTSLPVVATKRTWTVKEDAQEAHEAIRPSTFADLPTTADANESALYALIRDRAIASQLAAAQYRTQQHIYQSGDLCYIARSRVLTSAGWTALTSPDIDEDSEDEHNVSALPALSIGTTVPVQSGALEKRATKPSPRFTQATLIKALVAHGIGRPSSYAAILDGLLARTYVEERGKALIPTPCAFSLIDLLVETQCSFVDLGYTASLEQHLDDIVTGDAQPLAVITTAHQQLTDALQAIGRRAPVEACPACGSPMQRRQSKRGAFFGCSTYPTCKRIVPIEAASTPVPPSPKAAPRQRRKHHESRQAR